MFVNNTRNVITQGIIFLFMFLVMAIAQGVFDYSNSYLTIAIFVIYLVFIFFSGKRFFLSYAYIIFYICTNVFGVFLIETDHFFLTELQTYTSHNSSLPFLVLAHFVFIETLRVAYSSSDAEFPVKSNASIKIFDFEISKEKVLKGILIAIFILFAVLFIMVIDKPYFVVGLDRFRYEEQYMSFLTVKISNLSLYFSAFIGMYYLHTKDKKLTIPLILLIAVYLFWIGNKFSAFLVIGFIIALPFIYYVSRKSLNKFLAGGAALICLLLIVVSIQSFIVYHRNFQENFKYIEMRLAQQGQLWWGTFGVQDAHKTHFNELDDEYKTYYNLHVSKEALYHSGTYKIMRLTTPKKRVHQKIYKKNSRYAYATQASVFYYFNEFGLVVFSLVSALLYFLVNRNLLRSMAGFKIIPALLYARLFVIFNRVLLQADFDKLFSFQVILIVLILIGFHWFDRNKSDGKAFGYLKLKL